MTQQLAILLVSAALLAACGNPMTPAQQNSTAPGAALSSGQEALKDLQGNWQSSCLPRSGGGTKIYKYRFEGNVLTITVEHFLSDKPDECVISWARYVDHMIINPLQASAAVPGATEVELFLSSIEATPMSQAAADRFNSDNYCNTASWQSGVTKSFDQSCDPKNLGHYKDIFKVEGNSFFWGVTDYSNPMTAPTSLDRAYPFQRVP